jgi:heparan-alpha-glucosaminide N-acetyltransferase
MLKGYSAGMASMDSSPLPPRLLSLDVYRGFVMLLMAAEMMELYRLGELFPGSAAAAFIAAQSSHVEWAGCSLHDLIQPSFSFMVGAALPFSLTRRLTEGQSKLGLWLHALWRSLLLVLLGVFLRSIGEQQTYWTFEDTLSQIGLGYPFLFLLGMASTRVRWLSLGVILLGYWALFATWPLTAARGLVPEGWTHDFTGFAAHWNINHNPAWALDQWLLGEVLPRAQPFVGNDGGYSTLSFVPTLGTMLLGLLAGTWLRGGKPLRPLLLCGVGCMGLGLLLHHTGVCPSVKKIWTPAWVLFSGGWCCFLMAAFYWVLDVQQIRRWAFPLQVIGMNSLAMYVMAHTVHGFIGDALHTHLGKAVFQLLGAAWEPLLHGGCVLIILWLVLLWMHRRRLYLRL